MDPLIGRLMDRLGQKRRRKSSCVQLSLQSVWMIEWTMFDEVLSCVKCLLQTWKDRW